VRLYRYSVHRLVNCLRVVAPSRDPAALAASLDEVPCRWTTLNVASRLGHMFGPVPEGSQTESQRVSGTHHCPSVRRVRPGPADVRTAPSTRRRIHCKGKRPLGKDVQMTVDHDLIIWLIKDLVSRQLDTHHISHVGLSWLYDLRFGLTSGTPPRGTLSRQG
jgi:hypothetical protein